MANQFIKNHEAEVEEAFEHFKKEMSALRTGRANPALVENLLVESYGAKTPLLQLASISVPEPRTISIDPWDKNLLKDIEKAINISDTGLKAVVDGKIIRINLPQMTQEDREKLVKVLKEKLEHAKVSVRSIREKIKEEIVEAEKKKELTEDDKFDFLKQLDDEIEEWNKKLNEMAQNKEKEIMTV